MDQDTINRVSLRLGEEWDDQDDYEKAVAILCESLNITLNSAKRNRLGNVIRGSDAKPDRSPKGDRIGECYIL